MDIIKINDTSNKLYYIGGVVRDEILGIKSFDIDLTYAGNAIEYAKTLENAEILQINEPFGTVRIKINGKEIDIASTRKETYEKKGHLPQVSEIGCSLKDDVLRRDFTINTLAKSVNTGEIIDYTGGLEDIRNKKLKVLHNNSFIDDPTRILRGLKFSTRFNFELDEHTKILQEQYLENINYDMCYKRIKKELIETFNLNSQKAFEKFIKEKIYKLITTNNIQIPKINIEQLIKKYKIDDPWIIYIGVLKDLSRLPLTKSEQKILSDLNNIKNPKTDFEIYKAFENVSIKTVILYAILKDYDKAVRYLDFLQNIKLTITGKDLQNAGLMPSPKYKEIFDTILKQKIATPNITKEDELNMAKSLF